MFASNVDVASSNNLTLHRLTGRPVCALHYNLPPERHVDGTKLNETLTFSQKKGGGDGDSKFEI